MVTSAQHVAIWIAIGLAAGWLAGVTIGRQHRIGILGSLTIGGLGALTGGLALHRLHLVAPNNLPGHALTALSGAVVLLLAVRSLARLMSAVSHGANPHHHGADFDEWLRRANQFERDLLARLVHSGPSPARDPNQAFEETLTFGERIADKVASFGGSWTFIGLFFIVMISWMVINEQTTQAFDPFPFILLNLVLSCLAALQAPIIMMSQNRQAARDRADVRDDYEVNLRTELQIMLLHEKIDSARREEWSHIAEDLKLLREWRERIDDVVSRPAND